MKILLLTLLVSINVYAKLDERLMKQFNAFKKEVKCPLIITSGYRSIEDNKRVGGVKNSYHLKGKALDLIFLCTKTLEEINVIAKKYFNGVIVYKKHIHVDIRDNVYHNEGKY